MGKIYVGGPRQFYIDANNLEYHARNRFEFQPVASHLIKIGEKRKLV